MINRKIIFPVKYNGKKIDSYKTVRAAKFGSNRTLRLHAGADIYAPVGTEVYACEDGIVRRVSEKFYKNVGAIEITHKTCIGRYCEITPLKGIDIGTEVKQGQLIGHVAKIDGLDISMLHFELYDNQDDKTALTVTPKPPYNRRADLLNPTEYLDKAE
jgi:murein DD-endopeptidase MepM/ murein hydrolase activator NlpD